MSAARRDQAKKAAVFAGSALGHLVVFALIGLHAPKAPDRTMEDEEAAMVVDLFRPPPPPRTARPEVRRDGAPSPVRPREAVAPRPTVAPLPMVTAPRPAEPARAFPPTGAGSGGAAPGPGAGQPGGDLRGALRGSTVGCANRGAVGLNRRETEACDERLGKGARDAPFIVAPMGREKRARYDAAAARKERDRRWREAQMPAGIDPGASPGQITGLGK